MHWKEWTLVLLYLINRRSFQASGLMFFLVSCQSRTWESWEEKKKKQTHPQFPYFLWCTFRRQGKFVDVCDSVNQSLSIIAHPIIMLRVIMERWPISQRSYIQGKIDLLKTHFLEIKLMLLLCEGISGQCCKFVVRIQS